MKYGQEVPDHALESRVPNDLPLNAMCRNIEISVLELLGETTLAPHQPVDGVLL